MNISTNCLEIIEESEGLRLEAYIDPVGIPTIGYGTIRYPDGRKVRMGDTLSERQAEVYLKLECDKTTAQVLELVTVELTQNQLDALVSFCYNVGIGAFAGSTLLKKLNRRDYDGAASEFLQWNKGKVNGVKQELKGLTRRRAKEGMLFSRVGKEGVALVTEESPRDKATLVEGYREGDKTILVARTADRVIEILELDTAVKDHWLAALAQYPNVAAFGIAPAGKPVPDGERIVFSLRDAAIRPAPDRPRFLRLLARGAEGEDVERLQQRLKDLGFYEGPIDGDFGRLTDEAVKEFQTRVFGLSGADGKVGEQTWGKLWGEDARQPAPAAPEPTVGSKSFLRLTKTDRRDEVGCCVLELSYFKTGRPKDLLEVCSGAPSRQFFRTADRSISGSFEPLPEGQWRLHEIEWADGKDNYSGKIWNRGLGPAKIRLEYVGPGTVKRTAIEIHIDWNREQRGAGTAGCVGIHNIADYKTLVTWLRESDPRDLFVDWGLGTCPSP
jgi:lysozyme